jgi:two-component system, OmpR family, sensor histidine kinase KdpD
MPAHWRKLAERIREPEGRGRPWLAYGLSMLAVVALGLAVMPFREDIGGASVSLLYVLLLLGIGLEFGTGPAVASAVLAFLVTNLFFYAPYNTLEVDGTVHIVTVSIFLGIATSAGVLAARLRRRADDARREARRTSMLYDLNRALITDVTLDQVLTSIVRGVVELYGAKASRLMVKDEGDDGNLMAAAAWPETYQPTDSRETRHLARHAVESGAITGLGTAGRRVMLPHGFDGRVANVMRRTGDDLLYVPVGTSDRRFGVLEVSGRPGGGRFGKEDERMLKSFADQAALAVERARLIEQVTQRRAFEQSSELKSALLATVSHDLRTPLAAIKMSASALQDPSIEWDDASRTELLSAIGESSDWLARVVENLLDLSRIEGGALKPDRDWYDLSDLLQHVVMQMERQLAHHPLTLEIDPEVPLVCLDYVQISQVMTNLIANSVNYSEPGSPIEVAAAPVEGGSDVELRVTDHGIGIPKARLPHVFETFYRIPSGHGAPGSGVGLAICKGLVEADGGTIWAESVVGQGTTMRVRLPIAPGEGEGAGA